MKEQKKNFLPIRLVQTKSLSNNKKFIQLIINPTSIRSKTVSLSLLLCNKRFNLTIISTINKMIQITNKNMFRKAIKMLEKIS